MNIKFWGVRGSVPTPLTPAQVTSKINEAVRLSKEGLPLTFEQSSTYGGNTTCVEVNCANQLFILDMGTGVRELGKSQMSGLMKTKELSGTILQSHVHWDHIQGIPFWAPLYLPRRQFSCNFNFFGGKQWDSQLDLVYRGQMNSPVFPVNLEELEQTAMNMNFNNIYDGWGTSFFNNKQAQYVGQELDLMGLGKVDESCITKVLARKLFHPQETFGYRIECANKKIAFTTDHEPYFGSSVPKGLLELVQDVDIWITDCQYTLHQYEGKTGPQKLGWGHSFPEYIAMVAKEAKPKKIITTHHDPDASDELISQIARNVQEMCNIETSAAYEGLSLNL